MHNCTACNTSFSPEPFRSDETEGAYCSIECLPEGALDSMDA